MTYEEIKALIDASSLKQVFTDILTVNNQQQNEMKALRTLIVEKQDEMKMNEEKAIAFVKYCDKAGLADKQKSFMTVSHITASKVYFIQYDLHNSSFVRMGKKKIKSL